MSNSDQNKIIEKRVAAKKASRKNDRDLLAAGYEPKKLQSENSILPEGFFDDHKISNFAQAVGR